MEWFQVLDLLILIWLTRMVIVAQEDFSKPGCDYMCGNVKIEFPFGIGRNCSLKEWYTIDCNSSTPYLPALNNVQVLSVDTSVPIITVMMSVIKVDCKNAVQNRNHVLMSTTHGKSPFWISGSYNTMVFQGCGDAAIMEENGTIIARCSTTCGNDTISDIKYCFGVGCCQTTFPHYVESFTLNVKGLERRNCAGSAFLVDTYLLGQFPSNYNVKNLSFVPISLSWNESLCNDRCGEVAIPYPFGIGSFCSRDEWYNVDCNSSTPYLTALNNVELLDVDMRSQRLTANVPVISDCENPVRNSSLVLTTSPFVFSESDNLFVVEGCGIATIIEESGTIAGGCSTTCENDTVYGTNNCFGVGCCQSYIRFIDDSRSFTMNLTGLKREYGNGSCVGLAYVVNRILFMEEKFSRELVPVTLEWAYRYSSSYEISSQCRSCEFNRGFCYPGRYNYSFAICRYGSNKKSYDGVILGISISTGVLILTVVIYVLYKIIKKTKVKRRKQICFKRNGGLLLKQQNANDISLVDKTILFTSDELEKATNNFNENRVIGRGGQGTVYKGMLVDGRIVAIKKSKVVDESQVEQFINEVVVLSQVNHRNVVRLLGCCLETEVPLLVSEFVPNGTLYDLIQDETAEFSFSLNNRLQIAAEVSGAIYYLHSATSIPIYHRDIKTKNILLDEKYRAKVSDFGTSRFVSVDQTHLTTIVKGTFGYLDPEYFQSSQFTEKSDVYSFGVVLLELMTREKPISLTRFGENRSLATHFLLAMEEGRVMSIFDEMVVKEGSRSELMAIANLAMRCLNVSGRNRPTMKEVYIELEGIRLSHVPSTVQTNFEHVKQCKEVRSTYSESASTSMTFYDNPS